jgi:carbon storage regulator
MVIFDLARGLLWSRKRPRSLHPTWKEKQTMLVLTRKINESILIDNNIVVKIVKVDGKSVRLAIEAPREVTIDRAEVHDRRLEFVDIDLQFFQSEGLTALSPG